MSNVFDQEGSFLGEVSSTFGALPSDAVRVQSSLTMLTGKYVDSDGIIYDPNGSINESATAAYAREMAMRGTAAQNIYKPYDPAEIKRESVQEQSAADSTRIGVDNFFDNIYQTAESIPGYTANAIGGAWTGIQWLIVGLVAIAVIQTMDRVPSRGHVKRYMRKQVREQRKRLAKHVAGV